MFVHHIYMSFLSSSDGAAGCGVFIAAYNATLQVLVEGAVNLFSVVHDIHVRRPEMMTTMVHVLHVTLNTRFIDFVVQLCSFFVLNGVISQYIVSTCDT